MRFGVKLITNHHNSLLTFYARLSDFSGHELDWNKFWIQPSLSALCALIFSYSAIDNCLSIAEEVGWQESSPSSCDRRRNGGCCQKGETHLILVAVYDQIYVWAIAALINHFEFDSLQFSREVIPIVSDWGVFVPEVFCTHWGWGGWGHDITKRIYFLDITGCPYNT